MEEKPEVLSPENKKEALEIARLISLIDESAGNEVVASQIADVLFAVQTLTDPRFAFMQTFRSEEQKNELRKQCIDSIRAEGVSESLAELRRILKEIQAAIDISPD